jgi:hypothetical protein
MCQCANVPILGGALVIPAQAGISGLRATGQEIPASAGMTVLA